MELLKSEFPQLKFEKFPSFTIKYSNNKSLVPAMFFQSFKIIAGIYKEHQYLKKLIRKHQIDIVISDNRFGLWNSNIYSVFITHQIQIKMPASLKFIESSVRAINNYFIKKFDVCWIPDNENGENLSGELSHVSDLPENTKFIGHLSRFNELVSYFETKDRFDIIAILSGPEPQRTNLENILIKQLSNSKLKSLIVRGIPDNENNASDSGNITLVPHLPKNKLKAAILNSCFVICRSGYSSVMDLAALRKTAILIPTPGQTEQEYLAEYLAEKDMFVFEKQSNFNLSRALEQIKIKNPVFPEFGSGLLDKAIAEL